MTLLQKIKDRCHIEHGTGCWIWKGATSPSNGGKYRNTRVYSVDYTTDPSGKTKTVQTGNRAVWHAVTRKPIEPGHRVYRAAHCINGMCLNPAHLECGTTQEWGQLIASRSVWKGQAARIQANRASAKSRSSVTKKIALEIVGSTDSGVAISARTGLSRSTISRVRTGQLVSVLAVGNPFSGLLRNAA